MELGGGSGDNLLRECRILTGGGAGGVILRSIQSVGVSVSHIVQIYTYRLEETRPTLCVADRVPGSSCCLLAETCVSPAAPVTSKALILPARGSSPMSRSINSREVLVFTSLHDLAILRCLVHCHFSALASKALPDHQQADLTSTRL